MSETSETMKETALADGACLYQKFGQVTSNAVAPEAATSDATDPEVCPFKAGLGKKSKSTTAVTQQQLEATLENLQALVLKADETHKLAQEV